MKKLITALYALQMILAAPSTAQISSNEPLFYPNPAKNSIHFLKPQNITLTNMNGQVIYKGKFVTSLDVSAMNPGVYFLTINNQKGNVLKISRLVKE